MMFWKSLTLLFWLALIGTGLGSGFALWGPPITHAGKGPPPQIARIAERFPERQFIVPVELKGEEGTTAGENFLIDTGAMAVTVSVDLFKKLRLVPLDETVIGGVGGMQKSVRIRIPEMQIGTIVLYNVEAAVTNDLNLLGMTFLEQMRRVEMQGSILTLEK